MRYKLTYKVDTPLEEVRGEDWGDTEALHTALRKRFFLNSNYKVLDIKEEWVEVEVIVTFEADSFLDAVSQANDYENYKLYLNNELIYEKEI